MFLVYDDATVTRFSAKVKHWLFLTISALHESNVCAALVRVCIICMCECVWRVKIDFYFTCRVWWQMQRSYIYACKLIKLEAKTSKCTMGECVYVWCWLCVVGRREAERRVSVYSLVHQEKLVTLVVQASPFTREHVSLNEDRLTYSALEPAAFPPTRERALCKSVKIIQTNQYQNKHSRARTLAVRRFN